MYECETEEPWRALPGRPGWLMWKEQPLGDGAGIV